MGRRGVNVFLGLAVLCFSILNTVDCLANVHVEFDVVRVERRNNVLTLVAAGPGPFRSAIGNARPLNELARSLGAAQLGQVTMERRAFTSRNYDNGSLIFNVSLGTWTGMNLYLPAGSVFAAGSTGGNGATGQVWNNRRNLTISMNLAPYNFNTNPTVLWMRMPTGAGYEGELQGRLAHNTGFRGLFSPLFAMLKISSAFASSRTCVVSPSSSSVISDLVELSKNVGFGEPFEPLEVCY